MKRALCILFSVVILFNLGSIVFANEETFSVEDVAVALINDAIEKPDYFQLPSVDGKSLYICNAINPYRVSDDELVNCENIEYYLVRTEDEYFACITLLYADGQLLSASLNLDVSEEISNSCTINDSIQIIVQDGNIYIRTANGLTNSRNNNADISDSKEQLVLQGIIATSKMRTEVPSIKSQLTGIVNNPVIPRSTKMLNVPYVSQEGMNICWAAAGAAFGRYYTGNSYTHLSASALARLMGHEATKAGMQTTRQMLSSIFNVNTTYYPGRLSNGTSINLFQQNKPILAGFYGYIIASNEEAGHMVVLCGFDDGWTGGQVTYYVRDSNTENIMSVISYSNTELAMDYYSGLVMYWVESAY